MKSNSTVLPIFLHQAQVHAQLGDKGQQLLPQQSSIINVGGMEVMGS